MKTLKGIIIGLGVLVLSGILQAQLAVSSAETSTSDSIVQVTAEAYGLQPVAPENLPLFASCWWTVCPGNNRPLPMPCPPVDLTVPIYEIAPGILLVDATGGAVSINSSKQAVTSSTVATAAEAQGNAIADLIEQVQQAQLENEFAELMGIDLMSLESEGGMSGAMLMTYDPDGLWLEITNVSSGTVHALLHNGTNQVYAIWGTTNILAGWEVQSEVWPPDTNAMPFTLLTLNRQQLFLRAQDWTGVTENGNNIPNWWLWLYFGTTALSDTNLDSQGRTLLYDYQSGIDPNIISFSVEVTNNYVNNTTVPVQFKVSAGLPRYYAVLIDDVNYSNAVWNLYTTSNLNVNIGSSLGWHDVWIGLKGRSFNSTESWQWKHLNYTPPPIICITNPAVGTVSQPIIQIYGYCQESLANISYDVSNAWGVVSGLKSDLTDRHFDTNTGEFTTNYFQCLDVPLTNGPNVITFHAKDLAGNETVTNFNFTLDYTGKSAPSAQIAWPQNGLQIGSSNFTCQGVISDPTATVSTFIVLTNGTTNFYTATVERNGTFWLENLPMHSGTNSFLISVIDIANNITTTNVSVVCSPLTLSINPVSVDLLWQSTVNVTGTISSTNQAVWVNGVKGHVNGNKTWYANNVPVIGDGTASFTATAYEPTEQQPDGSYGNNQ